MQRHGGVNITRQFSLDKALVDAARRYTARRQRSHWQPAASSGNRCDAPPSPLLKAAKSEIAARCAHSRSACIELDSSDLLIGRRASRFHTAIGTMNIHTQASFPPSFVHSTKHSPSRLLTYSVLERMRQPSRRSGDKVCANSDALLVYIGKMKLLLHSFFFVI